MNLDGVRIYDEGVGLSPSHVDKIRRIIGVVKDISSASEVSMRFLKVGASYEGMLWGKVNNVPIGAYNRGTTIMQVLESLYRRVKKESFKIWKLNKDQLRLIGKNHVSSNWHWPLQVKSF